MWSRTLIARILSMRWSTARQRSDFFTYLSPFGCSKWIWTSEKMRKKPSTVYREPPWKLCSSLLSLSTLPRNSCFKLRNYRRSHRHSLSSSTKRTNTVPQWTVSRTCRWRRRRISASSSICDEWGSSCEHARPPASPWACTLFSHQRRAIAACLGDPGPLPISCLVDWETRRSSARHSLHPFGSLTRVL